MSFQERLLFKPNLHPSKEMLLGILLVNSQQLELELESQGFLM
jgi:hypothetical protein